ncbi:MAG: outer membrane beta-barrel protein [Acidobacteriota bacterium]
MKKYLALLIILFTAGSVFASDYRIELKMSCFNPQEQVFKDIYGSGSMCGIKAEKSRVYKKFGIIVEAGYFEKKGKLTFTKEDTTVKITFLGPGIIYQLTKGRFDLYGGAGFRYYYFEERNPIGHAQKGGVGYFLSVGTYIHITKKFYADVSVNYSGCQVKPADLKVEIGGIEAGIGLAYKF